MTLAQTFKALIGRPLRQDSAKIASDLHRIAD